MNHKLITDEMVEKAVKACDAAPLDLETEPEEAVVRAALESVADDWIEVCAQVADTALRTYQDGVRRSLDNPLFDARYSEGKEDAYEEIAKQIRLLKAKP